MAGRDFNIPYGPDRTGGFDLSKVVPEVIPEEQLAEPAVDGPSVAELDVPAVIAQDEMQQPESAQPADPDQTWAMPAPVAGAEPLPSDEEPINAPAPDSAFEAAPASVYAAEATSGYEVDAAQADQASATPIIAPDFGASEAASGQSGEEAGELVEEQGADEDHSQGIGDVQKSFVALKNSIGQGRELKARERELEELEEKIAGDREELADRDDILANYQALVAEQDAIIEQNTRERDAQKAALSQLVARTEDTSEELDRMREYNDAQLDPYETALGRARAAADQAKNDERSRKSELNAAESEARRAEKGDDATVAQARLEVVKTAHEEAVARSMAAKEALDDAQRAYDDIRAQVEQAEAPLERSLEDLQKQTEELKDDIARLGEVISTATKRRQYCDSVYQYPEETEKLRQSISDDETSAMQLDAENDELRGLLAESKASSTKAKVVIGIVAVVIIFIILLVWFLSSK